MVSRSNVIAASALDWKKLIVKTRLTDLDASEGEER